MARVPLRLSGKGSPPEPAHVIGNLEKPESEAVATLNFKVPEAFKVEFKMTAARDGKSMNKVLKEAFALYASSGN